VEHVSCTPDGIMEWWNIGLNKELIHFIASLSRGILPIDQYPIFPPSRCELVLNKVKEDKITHYSIIPLFHYSNIPIVSEAN